MHPSVLRLVTPRVSTLRTCFSKRQSKFPRSTDDPKSQRFEPKKRWELIVWPRTSQKQAQDASAAAAQVQTLEQNDKDDSDEEIKIRLQHKDKSRNRPD